MSGATAENMDNEEPRRPTMVNGKSAEALQGYIKRIEHLDEQKTGIAEDIKLVKQEAKAEGFDVKIITRILAMRKKDAATLEEEDLLLEAYKIALGMTD